MANSNLTQAKKAKNDEFYTQFEDIQKEMNAYLDYDKDVFKGKTILLPCDDPAPNSSSGYTSKFLEYFTQNFSQLGIKKVISTSYALKSKQDVYNIGDQIALTIEGLQDDKKLTKFKKTKDYTNGRLAILTADDVNNDGKIDIHDVKWEYLKGDGDFRSDEVKKLRDEVDMIITNPPFSLFREFLAWIMESGKQFSIIGSKNAITYKEVFPLIASNKIWCGAESFSGGMWFRVPLGADFDKIIKDACYKNVPSIWFTNIDHGKRHQPLQLMTMADNKKFNKKVQKSDVCYKKYDNYDAIEVSFTNAIPSDYDGVMGVPISFLDKFNPEQFEILGCSYSYGRPKIWPDDTDMSTVVTIERERIKLYKRIFIRFARNMDNGL